MVWSNNYSLCEQDNDLDISQRAVATYYAPATLKVVCYVVLKPEL